MPGAGASQSTAAGRPRNLRDPSEAGAGAGPGNYPGLGNPLVRPETRCKVSDEEMGPGATWILVKKPITEIQSGYKANQ